MQSFAKSLLKRKDFQAFALISILLIIILLFVRVKFFPGTSFRGFSEIIMAPYLKLVIEFSQFFLGLLGKNILVEDNFAHLQNGLSFFIGSDYLSKTWTLLVFLVILCIQVSIQKKLVFAILAVILNFLLSALQIVLVSIFYSTSLEYTDYKSIAYTFVILILFSYILYMIKFSPFRLEKYLSPQYESKIGYTSQIVIAIYLAIIIKNLIISVFHFTLLNDLLLFSAKYLINLSPFEAIKEGKLLYGEYGNLYLAKYCLGIQSMYIFSAFVWLTGKQMWKKSIFILTGIIIINIANIIRLALLFIHIQKNGDYKLTMDLHDLFNITVYTLIFVLWVIWTEYFSDFWSRPKVNPTAK